MSINLIVNFEKLRAVDETIANMLVGFVDWFELVMPFASIFRKRRGVQKTHGNPSVPATILSAVRRADIFKFGKITSKIKTWL